MRRLVLSKIRPSVKQKLELTDRFASDTNRKLVDQLRFVKALDEIGRKQMIGHNVSTINISQMLGRLRKVTWPGNLIDLPTVQPLKS